MSLHPLQLVLDENLIDPGDLLWKGHEKAL